jgi:hydrogenase maturation protease
MNIAIMGFGNPVRSDDGVGCHVVERLRATYGGRDNVSLFDMGTSAFEVLFGLKGHDVIIIVDAVLNANEPDGTVFRLPAAAIQAAIVDDPMVFLHSLKWDQALSYAKKIMQDDFPEDRIYAYLIAVSDIRMEVGLSAPVAEAAEEVVRHIENDIAQNSHGTHL